MAVMLLVRSSGSQVPEAKRGANREGCRSGAGNRVWVAHVCYSVLRSNKRNQQINLCLLLSREGGLTWRTSRMDIVTLEEEVEAADAVLSGIEALPSEYKWTVICSYQFAPSEHGE